MLRSSLSAFAVGVLALAGCGGGTKTVIETAANSSSSSLPTASAPPATSGTPSTETTASSAAPLSLGQSASFVGGEIVGSGAGEQVSVTVQRVIDPATSGIVRLGSAAPPAPAGMRYVEVKLSLLSTGTAPYSDSPGMELSLISKSTNGPVGQNIPGTTGPGQCATDLSTSVNIPPGQTESGCLFFQAPVDQQIGAVQYQTQGGGPGYQATWTVS
jgi:hypothetical protein